MTCKDWVIKILMEAGDNGMAGGNLEVAVHDQSIHKASTVSRVARNMFNAGLLQRDYRNGYVWYRIRK